MQSSKFKSGHSCISIKGNSGQAILLQSTVPVISTLYLLLVIFFLLNKLAFLQPALSLDPI